MGKLLREHVTEDKLQDIWHAKKKVQYVFSPSWAVNEGLPIIIKEEGQARVKMAKVVTLADKEIMWSPDPLLWGQLQLDPTKRVDVLPKPTPEQMVNLCSMALTECYVQKSAAETRVEVLNSQKKQKPSDQQDDGTSGGPPNESTAGGAPMDTQS